MRSLLGQVQERASAPSEAGLPAAAPTRRKSLMTMWPGSF